MFACRKETKVHIPVWVFQVPCIEWYFALFTYATTLSIKILLHSYLPLFQLRDRLGGEVGGRGKLRKKNWMFWWQEVTSAFPWSLHLLHSSQGLDLMDAVIVLLAHSVYNIGLTLIWLILSTEIPIFSVCIWKEDYEFLLHLNWHILFVNVQGTMLCITTTTNGLFVLCPV